jgi:hypothetical protein
LEEAKNPAHVHAITFTTLKAKATIITSIAVVAAFGFSNLVADGAIFQSNPLLSPIGYLLLIDWRRLMSWQVCALSSAVLSIILVFWVNEASVRRGVAVDTGDTRLLRKAERQFGWIERLMRLRFVIFMLFWLLVGAHATLYANSRHCWFTLSPTLQSWALYTYGDHLPQDHCS